MRRSKVLGDGWKDAAAMKVAKLLLRVQVKFSKLMNHLISRLSLRKLKMALIGFCLVWGGMSVFFILDGVFGNGYDPMEIEPVKVNKLFSVPEVKSENKVDDEIYFKIQEYKRKMDSLKLQIPESMMDSIKLLEQIYLSQN